MNHKCIYSYILNNLIVHTLLLVCCLFIKILISLFIFLKGSVKLKKIRRLRFVASLVKPTYMYVMNCGLTEFAMIVYSYILQGTKLPPLCLCNYASY